MYAHRYNEDGSWDSICKKCFQTAAHVLSDGTEAELSAFEASHHCEEPRESLPKELSPLLPIFFPR
jgi:hypothetical protein